MSPTEKDSKIRSEVGKDMPERTDRVSLDQTLFGLDADEYDAFANLFDDPPPAGPALMKRRPLWQK